MSQGERRLAAIMFTDMVGYTALGQRDESLSLALVDEHRKLLRPIFSRHNGREVKTIGDAFLVEFPSALDAVRCAYDVQRATREFNISLPSEKRVHLRVGVHLGDVVESQGDISGDAVNVASRIESLAEDGGVCLTRQVYDHVQNKFELPLASLGSKSLKNVSAPLEVYKMLMPWGEEKAILSTQLDKRRIAILPFANMSPDPADEYFADGMTEELISTMSKISGLRVIARTSVMGYKAGQKKISEVARELVVGTIVEGSVRKASDDLRITVQLIDVQSEEHLWSQTYDRKLENIFAIQRDVARRIAKALRIRLVSKEEERLNKSPTRSLNAYTLYLMGQSYRQKSTKEGIDLSIEYFRKALEIDPRFALAYVGMATSFENLGTMNYLPEREAFPKARELVTKAIELDEELADAHCILAEIMFQYDWNWTGAERELRRSLSLNPNLARAHMSYAFLLLLMGRQEKPLVEAARAQELDPNSASIQEAASFVPYMLRLYDLSMEKSLKLLETDPNHPAGHTNLGLDLLMTKRFDESIEELQKAVTLLNGSDFSKSNLAFGYAVSGNKGAATQILDELIEASRIRPVAQFLVAQIFVGLGDGDRAFEWMEKAYEERSSYLPWIKVDPMFDSLRADPRYAQLLGRLDIYPSADVGAPT